MNTDPALVETPEDRLDRQWLRDVYQGDSVPQLTPRAVVSGMAIGGLMAVSNLYVGLKTGWGLGVTITASIIAYAVFKSLETIVPAYRRRPFSILENCCMTSAASAAGYISSAGLVSTFPALYLTTGRVLQWWEMMLWLSTMCMLGVFMAVPVKRQLVNIDKLPFPSGTATAETLKGLHNTGGDAHLRARALLYCGAMAAVFKFWMDAWTPICTWLGAKLKLAELGKTIGSLKLPETLPFLPGEFSSNLLNRYTIGFECSTFMVAAGAIMGIRVGVSLLIGGLFYFGVLAPILESYGAIVIDPDRAYKSIVQWTLWPSTAMMVSAGLLSFALRWRTVVRAMSGLAAVFGRRKTADPLAHVEVPGTWFVLGVGLAGTSAVVLGYVLFGIAWWASVLAVLITFVLAIVAARATGETDITPISAMGKITQLTFGIITPNDVPGKFMSTNLMTASITAGASSNCADLLTDLKAGYMLGANPRRQALAQLFGVVAGALIAVPVFVVVVRMPAFDPATEPVPLAKLEAGDAQTADGKPIKTTNLGTPQFPVPSAVVWKGVAEMLGNGLKALPDGALWGMAIGAILGIVLTLGDEYLPPHVRRWWPSATGLGIAGIIPCFNSISMFLGALVAWIWTKKAPESAERYIIAGSSGLIAGESLMGVSVNLAEAVPVLAKSIVG